MTNLRYRRFPTRSLLLLLFTVVIWCTAAEAERVVIARFAGSETVSRDLLTDGLTGYVNPCGVYSNYSDQFALEVTMGSFTDYYLPNKGVTVCDLLTASARSGSYRFSRTNPTAAGWDGRTQAVFSASPWQSALGGARYGYLNSILDDGREMPSFWGDDSPSEVRRGGCCYTAPFQERQWGKPFTLALYPLSSDALYLSFMVVPAAVVEGGPMTVSVNVWNFRGTHYTGGQLSFDVIINGVKTTVSSTETSTTGPLEATLDYTAAAVNANGASTVAVSVTLNEPLPAGFAGATTITTNVAVIAAYPEEVTPISDKPLTKLLHFGSLDSETSVGPVTEEVALSTDWFATASTGGEALLEPISGRVDTTLSDVGVPAVTTTWLDEEANADDGEGFTNKAVAKDGVSTASGGFVQFYAFVLYSAATQQIGMEITAADNVAVYVGGSKLDFPDGLAVPGAAGTLTRYGQTLWVNESYQQVLIKLYAADDGTSTHTNYLRVRVFGSGVGYATEMPLRPPPGGFAMPDRGYMFYLLNSGATYDSIMGADSIDEDLIGGIHQAFPRQGGLVREGGTERWSVIVFYRGSIPVEGKDLPEGKAYGVKYVASALYNAYPFTITISWQLEVRGKTDFYVDGVPQYSSTANEATTAHVVTELSPGWHQVIARVATRRDHSWIFRFHIYFSWIRLFGALAIGGSLGYIPPGVRQVESGLPMRYMMALTSTTTNELYVPNNFRNATEASREFRNFVGSSADRPHAHNYDPNEEITVEYSHAAASTAAGAPLSSTAVYRWVATPVKTGGWWRGSAVGGDSSNYYYFVLYSNVTGATAQLRFQYTNSKISLWLNDVFTAVADDATGTSGSVTLSLSEGWNHVTLRQLSSVGMSVTALDLATNSSPLEWDEVMERCAATYNGNGVVCSAASLCPMGQPRAGQPYPLTSVKASYIAVSDKSDTWVQIASPGDSVASLCQQRESFSASELFPNFATTSQYVACCEAVPPAFSFTITPKPPAGSSGGAYVGFAYTDSDVLATPRLTKGSVRARNQTVHLAAQEEYGEVYYRIAYKGFYNMFTQEPNDDTDFELFTQDVKISEPAMVYAYTSLRGNAGPTASYDISVPLTVTINRDTCLLDSPCAIMFSGVSPGWRASLLLSSVDPVKARSYNDPAFAATQTPNATFSGLATIDDRFTAVFPSSGMRGEYKLIVYPSVVDASGSTTGSTEGFVSFVSMKLFPTSVSKAAATATVFHAEGLTSSDAHVFPQVVRPGTSSCDTATCQDALKSQTVSTVNTGAYFTADISPSRDAALDCVCVCLSCIDADDGTYVYQENQVLPVAVSVAVVAGDAGQVDSTSTTTTSTTAEPCPPTKSGYSGSVVAALAIVTVAALLVACGALLFIVVVYCRPSKRRADTIITGVDAHNGLAENPSATVTGATAASTGTAAPQPGTDAAASSVPDPYAPREHGPRSQTTAFDQVPKQYQQL